MAIKKYLSLDGLTRFKEKLTATFIPYDNTSSGMTATNVQGVIDELNSKLNMSEKDGTNNWLKLPDGTLFCWGKITVEASANTISMGTWTFPENFYYPPFCVANPLTGVIGSKVKGVNCPTTTTTEATVSIYRTDTVDTSVTVFAIGRWKE